MHLSCCTWALSGEHRDVLTTLAGAGFRRIDIRPFDFTSDDAQTLIKQLGLKVSCVAASFGMPEGASLESDDPSLEALALEHTEQALKYARRTGATAAYVVPGTDGSRDTLSRYADAIAEVAGRAAALGVKLCIEHFPGRALPTATATLDFIRDVGHPNVYLLFDIGHAQMAGEDAAEAIAAAGPRLGYVHLDDNDGKRDLHWALCDGALTEPALDRMFRTLRDAGYAGAVSLEMHPSLPDPLDALIRSREAALRVGEGYVNG